MKQIILSLLAVMLSSHAYAGVVSSCEQITEKTKVSAVYPTTDTLPENLLRFYIYFSNPMQRQDILSSVYLTDSKGKKQEGVFLHNRFDLWSPDSTRLTLLFDPGRVKTGLVAHNAMGRALKVGSFYQLTIDTSAKDSKGCSLATRFSKPFTTTIADDKKPNINLWKISQPKVGSKETLMVELNGVMDHVSLAYQIRVKDATGQTIGGSIDLAKQEQQWLFTPDQAWSENTYQLVVNSVLEDLVGNRISGLFDQSSLAEENANQQQWVTRPILLEPR